MAHESFRLLATARNTARPALRGDASSQVVVVGGGIAGLTCAQTLAERGVEVSVVERAFCGSGASGRSIWSGLIGVSKDFVPIAGRHPSLPRVCFAGAAAGLPWAAALGAYLADKVSDGRDELDAVLSADRPFAIGPPLQSFLGKPLAFLLSHGTAKYLRKG